MANNNEKAVHQLTSILTEYKALQSERRKILGFGNTDKRNVVKKAKDLDERMKSLKQSWNETVRSVFPDYAALLKKTLPTQKTLDMIKQLTDSERR